MSLHGSIALQGLLGLDNLVMYLILLGLEETRQEEAAFDILFGVKVGFLLGPPRTVMQVEI